MAGKDNLIPIRTKERAREIGQRGGKVKSQKKKIAARIRELKKKGLTNENAKRLVQVLEDPELSMLDIFTYIQSIKSSCTNAYQKTNLANTLINWHKAHHGEKMNVESKNINISITIDEALDRIHEYKRKVNKS